MSNLFKTTFLGLFFGTFGTYILKVQLAIRFNGSKNPKKNVTF